MKGSGTGDEVHSTVKPQHSSHKPHKALVSEVQTSACLPKQALPEMPDASRVSFYLQQ